MNMMKPPNKGHLRITDKSSCTNLSVIKRFYESILGPSTIDDLGQHRERRSYRPCTNIHTTSFSSQPPSFVGNDYFCDTGGENMGGEYKFYADDPP